MPCFNAGRMLRPALLSVLHQTHPEIEAIFVALAARFEALGRRPPADGWFDLNALLERAPPP